MVNTSAGILGAEAEIKDGNEYHGTNEKHAAYC